MGAMSTTNPPPVLGAAVDADCTDGTPPHSTVAMADPLDDTWASTRGGEVSHTAATPPARAVVAGRYALEGALGSGGFGTVVRAEDRLSGEAVAVKFVRRLSDHNHKMFRKEIGLLRMLRLPGVVRFIDDGIHEGRPFLVTEIVDGTRFPGSGVTGWEDVEDRVIALAEALERVHAHGVVHRDLKPSNVLVTAAGQVVILDFGVSLAPSSEVSTSGNALGTPIYMAPEQMRGAPATVQSDLYALGLMLYQLCHGKPMFAGLPYADVQRLKDGRLPRPHGGIEVPEHVMELIGTLISPVPAMRPDGADTVAAVLQHGQRKRPPLSLSTIGPIATEEALRTLFHGPEIAFHLPSDAARLLFSRTQGHHESVERELAAWVRAGLGYWRDDKIEITREAIEWLATNGKLARAHRQVSASRSSQNLPAASSNDTGWSPAKRGLAHGHTAQQHYDSDTLVLTADSVVEPKAHNSQRVPSKVASFLELAEIARKQGKHGEAQARADGALALARTSGSARAVNLTLTELTKVAIDRQSVIAIDVALYELQRTDGEDAERSQLEALLRAARIARTGDNPERSTHAANAVAPFSDPELERLRHAQRLLAAGRGTLEEHRSVLSDAETWAGRAGDETLRAVVRGWGGVLAYREGDFDECIAANTEAAQNADAPFARLSALSNAAMASIESGAYEAAITLAAQGIEKAADLRSPFFEFRFRRLHFEARYRIGETTAIDDALLEVARLVDVPTESGPLAVTCAAIAWRAGDTEVAQEHASYACGCFRRSSLLAGEALAAALGAAAGAPVSPVCDAFLSQHCDAGSSLERQVRALLQLANAPQSVAQTPARTPTQPNVHEILAEHECLEILGDIASA